MPIFVIDPIDFSCRFETALNAGDLEEIVALYEDEAALRDQSGEVQTGAAAVRFEFEQLIAAGARITNTLRHTLVSGDTALILVDYMLRLNTPDGPAEMSCTATNALRRDLHGNRRMAIANPHGVV